MIHTIEIRAVFHVMDEDVAHLIESAKERCRVMGGVPDMITDISGAMVEFFDMVDYQGYSMEGLGLQFLSAFIDDSREAKYTCAVCDPDVADPDVDHCDRCQREDV